MKLRLGVIDIPYHKAPGAAVKKAAKGRNSGRGKKAPPPIAKPGAGGSQTTQQVAEWLENKYHVMETFADVQAPAIAFVLQDSLAGHLENLMAGAPAGGDPFAQATEDVTKMFKTFLAENEVAHAGVTGVPTAASLRGVNHRLKLKKGPPRPSFIDTGLYQSSSHAWMEE